jgi:hypothetical protein
MKSEFAQEDLDRYFRYLDELRDSEETNMMASPTYLRAVFRLSKSEAFRVVELWEQERRRA